MDELKNKLQKALKQELDDCVGLSGGRLSRDRETLKNAYHGRAYAVDQERQKHGWSVYVDRSVLETVEWAKGPLLKIFAASDELVRFEARCPEEEQYAREATDYVNKVVFAENAFELVYGPLTDGLYQRVGWAKVFFDERREKNVLREFSGLEEQEAQALAVSAAQNGLQADLSRERGGLFNLTLYREQINRGIRIEPLPSERVIYARDSVNIEKTRFIAHWEDRQAGELIAEGYAPDFVRRLPGREDDYPEAENRRGLNEDDGGPLERSDGSRLIRVYEAYMNADLEGDGRLKRLKVTFAGGPEHIEILDAEEWTMSRPPLFAACSLPLPYTPVGLSLADLVLDLQDLRTEMMRNILDNMYLSNHGEIHLNKGPGGKVNLDQFLSRAPGGVYESEGQVTLTPLPSANISQAALSGLELTDKAKEQRTGVGPRSQGLAADVLQNTATGAMIMEESQNVRLEMIARIYAETFYKPMARYALALANKYLTEPLHFLKQGRFASITPAAWSPDMSVRVSVGLGTGNRSRQAEALKQIIAQQSELLARLGKNSPVKGQELYNSYSKLIETWGFEAPEQFIGSREDWRRSERAMLSETPAQSPEQLKQLMQREKLLMEMKMQREKFQGLQYLQRQKALMQMSGLSARRRTDHALKAVDAANRARLSTAELASKNRLSVAALAAKKQLSEKQMSLEAALEALKLRGGPVGGWAARIKGAGTL